MTKMAYLGAIAAVVAGTIWVQPAAAADPIRLCTGGKSGVYTAVGLKIAEFGGRAVTIQVHPSDGSLDNIDRVTKLDVTDPEACDAMIVQPDGPVYVKNTSPAQASLLQEIGTPLHREYAQFLCNKESGIDDVEDLEGKENLSIAVGKPGSGAWLLWQNFIAESPGYGKVKTTTEADSLALSAVSSGDTTCALITAALGQPIMQEAEALYSKTIILADATDNDFNDAVDLKGKPLYQFTDISKKVYPKLTKWAWGDIETVSWNARVMINKQRVTGDQLNSFIQAVARGASWARGSYGE